MKLYDSYQPAQFIARVNRFVMRLLLNGEITDAYIPNTGSLAEYLVEGQTFYVTPRMGGKYRFKVIAVKHNGCFVFLDTIMANTLMFRLLEGGFVPGFETVAPIRREFSIAGSRFDFLIETTDGRDGIVEVKSCTLSHGGTAMFPDAPTERGRRHLRELQLLSRRGYDCTSIYLISDYSTRRFLPNFHTDEEYGEVFRRSRQVRMLPLKIRFSDPATCDPASLAPVPVERDLEEKHNRDGGAYLLVLENPAAFSTPVGGLGNVDFRAGFYVYAGSALRNLNARLARHRRRRKSIYWHIDHIIPGKMKILNIFPVRRADCVEEKLAADLLEICDAFIPQFGAGDSSQLSHLTCFHANPLRNREFFHVLLDYRMFVR